MLFRNNSLNLFQYVLPFEEAKKGAFEKLFTALDSNLKTLEINSYGVEDTSLEEVFLKVTEDSINKDEGQLLCAIMSIYVSLICCYILML